MFFFFFENLTSILVDCERKSIPVAKREPRDSRSQCLDHVSPKSRSECEQVVNIMHDARKKGIHEPPRTTRSHGTAFEPQLCVSKRRGAGSAPTTPYPPSLSPHHLASPPSRTILVLTRMVHPQTLRNYLPHPCSFPLLSFLFPSLLLSPSLSSFFHSILFFSSSLLRSVSLFCSSDTIFLFLILRRPFIYFPSSSVTFSLKVTPVFRSPLFPFYVSSSTFSYLV